MIATNRVTKKPAIDRVIFFAEGGNYVSFRGREQMPEENGNAWLPVLQDKLSRGVVNARTRVTIPGWEMVRTVGDLVEMGHLKVPNHFRTEA